MEVLYSLGAMILFTVGAVYLQPVFWLIIFFVWLQQRRSAKQQRLMFGLSGFQVWRHTLRALLLGSAGGILASLVIALIGIDLGRLGLAYIWPVAIALLLIDLRLLCFAYAGGLIALCHLITGWPDVDVAQLVALVAVLHLTEGLLIYASGQDSFLPVLVQGKNGIVGGFSLLNFWPLPLALLLAVPLQETQVLSGTLAMPAWWPVFPAALAPPEQLTYLLLPVVAALGYGDLALVCPPEERGRRAAAQLVLYSVSLLALALLSLKWPVFAWPAALLAPLGHEGMVQWQMRRELKGEARYAPAQRGVLILDVVPGSLASRAGLRREDVILAVDDLSLHSRDDFFLALTLSAQWPQELLILREGRVFSIRQTWSSDLTALGLLLVPNRPVGAYLTLAQSSLLNKAWNWLQRKF
ncbi:PDZ domain-containing protein [Azotosporobacter soli]|uniref:PDZ domain-containing protein n=1 Tax=Azotosporobacter soli TaxID=3055040 RepID=UPI0031FE6F90